MERGGKGEGPMKAKILPPQVVAHLVEKYNIEIRD